MQVGAGTRALITGASRGIGRALSAAVARRGGTVGLIARREEPQPTSLFEEQAPLADLHGEVASRYSAMYAEGEGSLHHVAAGQDWQEQRPELIDCGVIGTALCIEPRDGKLFVFMPPLARLESYLELLASVEHTAAELNLPVCIEGYAPPSDNRIEKFMITPDPGVIEVNIMPAASWPELV